MRRLLFILDGLCEPSGVPTTMELARTPFLDDLARKGVLASLDLQPESGTEEVPNTLPPSSERGIMRLLGFPGENTPPRATLLSCLFPRDESEEETMAILLNPASFGTDERLGDYVGDSDSIGRLWSFFEPVQTGEWYSDPESGLKIYPLRDARQKSILRLLVRVPKTMADSVFVEEWSPPVSGRKYPRSAWWLMEKIGHLMDFSGRLNGFWPWGAGPWHNARPFQKRDPSTGVMIAGAPIARAIGAYMGLDHPFVPGASGEIDTDIESIMRVARKSLEDGISPVVVHLEGFDLASHRKNREEKRAFLERFDREAGSGILDLLGNGMVDRIILTSDHRSSPQTGDHTPGPVPLLILGGAEMSGTAGRRNGLRFTEAIAEKQSRWDIARWQKIWEGSGGEFASWL